MPAATHGDLKHVPTTHSEPGSDKKLEDITKITPISTDCPALPSAFILGSGSVFTLSQMKKDFLYLNSHLCILQFSMKPILHYKHRPKQLFYHDHYFHSYLFHH